MADLKTFAAFDINTLYTDVADTEKGFHGAHATMVHNGYASPPLGAVNLDNPGGTTRSLTQWNGTAYTSFNANSPGGYQAPIYYFNLANCFVAQDIGTGNPGFLFDAGDYMDYNRTLNAWRVLIGGLERLYLTAAGASINSFALGTTAGNSSAIFNFENSNGNVSPLLVTAERLAVGTTWQTASTRLQKKVDTTYMGFIEFGDATGTGGVSIGAGQASTAQAVPTVLKMTGSGRTLIGTGATDDGVTALQTTSYSASNQPSLTGGSNPTALSIPVNTSPPLQIPTRTLKGGMIVYNSDQNIAVPVAGLYLLSGKILFNVAVQSTRVIVSLFKNASLFNYQSDFPPIPGNTYIVDLNAQIPMLASDVIILTATVNSAGSTPSAARITDLSFTKIN